MPQAWTKITALEPVHSQGYRSLTEPRVIPNQFKPFLRSDDASHLPFPPVQIPSRLVRRRRQRRSAAIKFSRRPQSIEPVLSCASQCVSRGPAHPRCCDEGLQKKWLADISEETRNEREAPDILALQSLIWSEDSVPEFGRQVCDGSGQRHGGGRQELTMPVDNNMDF